MTARDCLVRPLCTAALAARRLFRGLVLTAVLAVPLGAQAQLPTPEVWVEGLACCDETGGQSYGQRAPRGVLSDGRPTLGPTGSASAQSVAGFGFLRVFGESAGIATADAAAGFVDRLTLLPVNPAFIGEVGVLEWQFALTGAVDLFDQGAGGFSQISVRANALNALAGTGEKYTEWSNPMEDGALVVINGDPLPWRVTVRQLFEFGAPVAIGLQVRVSSGAVEAYALADLMHTATWQGITQVSLFGQGLDPAAYDLSSASGTDYRSAITPVPEPASFWLWLLALPGLLWKVRRPRSP